MKKYNAIHSKKIIKQSTCGQQRSKSLGKHGTVRDGDETWVDGGQHRSGREEGKHQRNDSSTESIIK